MAQATQLENALLDQIVDELPSLVHMQDELEQRLQEREQMLKTRQGRWVQLALSEAVNSGGLDEAAVWRTARLLHHVPDDRAFSAVFGVHASVIALIWMRYGPELAAMEVFIMDILVFLSWTTTNSTADNLANSWRSNRTTMNDKTWEVMATLWFLLDEIHWEPLVWHKPEPRAPEGSLLHNVTYVIDGIECGIATPTNVVNEIAYLSEKAGKHTVKYENCTALGSGRIKWLSGGVPGSIHDMELAKATGVFDIAPEGEIGLADRGYAGAPPDRIMAVLKPQVFSDGPLVNVPCYTFEERVFNRVICSQRIEVERVYGRLKRFQVLWHSRMKDLTLHRMLFEVLANVVNIQIELEPMRKQTHPMLLFAPATRPVRSLVTADK